MFKTKRIYSIVVFGIVITASSEQDELYRWVHQIEPERNTMHPVETLYEESKTSVENPIENSYTESKKILKYSVRDICNEREKNELDLKTKISNKEVIVFGRIKSIKEDLQVVFEYGFCSVEMSFPNEKEDELRLLKKGDDVEIKCNSFYMSVFSTIKGENCELLSE
ncbi:hypothetical protein B7988_01725 [Fibrobacter sp. UWB1]|jgi:hypothetical protein|uniref:OB-fold protein n=1 Tax=Fibrobacter sp. UWB1 TaxID=1964355 RepID=UPI000B527741|nr:hypothetical protein [Fibrobacter sp. UWB1]OWV26913.1 hypothetical protein B7988_01725 [Fibrobacter sp. UWB1]